jgi:PAS domain S-box-containing protein
MKSDGRIVTDSEKTGVESRLGRHPADRIFSEILNVSFEAIILIGPDHRIEMYNKGAERVFGYTAAQIMGQPIDVLIPARFRGDHDDHMASFRNSDISSRLMDGRSEIKGLRKDGTEFPAEASISKLEVDGASFFTVVLRDVTHRHQIEKRLSEALERSNEASKAKSAFLANMSHELRTPLNAIIGFSELISLETFGPVENPRYLDYIREIHTSGNHLLSLVNDVLDLSKVESGKMELSEELVDVVAEVQACLYSLEVRAQQAEVTFEFVKTAGLPRLRADQRALKQIVLNLLSNAVKFTRPGGIVTIAVEVDGDNCFVVKISDTGIGIEAHDLERLSTPFTQVESSLSREFTGTGLGLPLVRSLAGLHGGSLRLQSEPGVGTIATVFFPASRIVDSPAG